MIELLAVVFLIGTLWMLGSVIGVIFKVVFGLIGALFSVLGAVIALIVAGVVGLALMPLALVFLVPVMAPLLFIGLFVWLVARAARGPGATSPRNAASTAG